MIQIAILLALSVVGVAMLLSLWRLLRGPTAPDRILALDTLYVNAVAQLILFGMVLDSEIYFEVALIIAMLGFFGTVVLSKYVIRRDIVE
jgi:multicomponent K+:H+ antiporter subunit F